MMAKEAVTVGGVIEKAGGVRAAGSACGVTVNAVQKWRSSNYIPPNAWPYLVANNREAITYEELEALFFQAAERRERRYGGKVGA